MQVWQLQKPFCNKYEPVWTLLSIQKIYPFGRNEKSDFYKLWQQDKEMSEAWLDFFDEGFIPQFQSEPTHKIH